MATCPKCGKENPGYVFYCGGCGTEIPEILRKMTLEREKAEAEASSAKPGLPSSSSSSTGSSAKPSGWADMMTCRACGSDYAPNLDRCPVCGKSKWDMDQGASYGMDGGRSIGRASGGLTAGGVLAMLAGVLALGQGLLYIAGSSAISYLSGSGYLCMCGGIDVLFGLGSIVGGIFAVKREKFMLAVVGAVVGMLGLGLMIGFVLGLIALLLIATAKSEFMS